MVSILRIDRILLLAYAVAILALLLLPVTDPQFQLLGVRSDKWWHVALFGGFAILLRWNISKFAYADWFSLGVAVTLAAAMEVIQGFVGRNPELLDIVAGIIGAVLGTLIMSRIMASNFSGKTVGMIVAILGLNLGFLSVSADLIGSGNNNNFGLGQMAGTVLGALVMIGGVTVYLKGLPRIR